jgi:hypothetical protein
MGDRLVSCYPLGMAEGDPGVEPETTIVSGGWEGGSVLEGQAELTPADFTKAVAHLPGSRDVELT